MEKLFKICSDEISYPVTSELGEDKLPIKIILSATLGEVPDPRMMILLLLGYSEPFFFREKTRHEKTRV